MNLFEQKLAELNLPLRRASLQTLQINLGRKCNQACRHCHVDAAPWRTEMMDEPTAKATGNGLMCRTTLSVDYRGRLYDRDFDQMLDLKIRDSQPLHLWEVTPGNSLDRSIRTGVHCLACTAGSGSSCTGALKEIKHHRSAD